MAALAAFLLLAATQTRRAPVVCIDPGHPSEVGIGTQGKRLTEVGVAWRVAQALQTRLRKDGYTVILTKSKERQTVRNRKRAEIGNAAKADLMLRLHCDASAGSGFTVYYPAQKGTVQGVTGPSQTVIDQSKTLARKFHAAMADSLRGKLPDEGLKTDRQTAVGGKQGALTGSIFAKTPVVLVEMVVLTNPKDEAFIGSAQGQAAMVEALASGVAAALGKSTRR